jgi:hypothetical protein
MEFARSVRSQSAWSTATFWKWKTMGKFVFAGVAMTSFLEKTHGPKSANSFCHSLFRWESKMKDKFSSLTQDVLYCHHNDLLDDEVGRSILDIYQAGVCDKTVAGMIERRVSKHKFQQAFYGNIPFITLSQQIHKIQSTASEFFWMFLVGTKPRPLEDFFRLANQVVMQPASPKEEDKAHT